MFLSYTEAITKFSLLYKILLVGLYSFLDKWTKHPQWRQLYLLIYSYLFSQSIIYNI